MTSYAIAALISQAPTWLKRPHPAKAASFFAWRDEKGPWTVRFYADDRIRTRPEDGHLSECVGVSDADA